MPDHKFIGFEDNTYIDRILRGEVCDESDIMTDGDTYMYVPTGDSVCWKCTLKHLGAAHEYASEVQKYPHHFIKCIGALVAACRECPSRFCRELIYAFYNDCLEKNIISDMNSLLTAVYNKYTEYVNN